MERQLELITNVKKIEKRLLPRYPISTLLFKDSSKNASHVYEVIDISLSGMQLHCKDSDYIKNYTEGDHLEGELRWKGKEIFIYGQVRWINSLNMGIEFDSLRTPLSERTSFFSIDNFICSLKHVPRDDINHYPRDLKYWLRSDGPLEVFVWEHRDREIQRFQIVYLDDFLEWEDGVGIRTGKIIGKKRIETPLTIEDEVTLNIDHSLRVGVFDISKRVLDSISEKLISPRISELMRIKLDF